MGSCSFLYPIKVEQMLLNNFENLIKKVTTDDCSIAILTMDDESFKGYKKLSDEEKLQFLNIDINNRKKKYNLTKYDLLLRYLNKPHSIDKIAKKFEVKKNTILKRLQHLLKLNLITFENDLYQSIVIMDKTKMLKQQY